MSNIKHTVTQKIPATEPDWSREKYSSFAWKPERALISSIKKYSKYSKLKGIASGFHRKIAVYRHRFWSIVTGSDISQQCQIGGGVLPQHPTDAVIHTDAKIGPNCLIFQQVTIGMRNGGAPTIGGHVDIGAGAKLLGPIKIGDHVKIGANAVVLNDVPSGCTVVGIPAKQI
jgi:serine O-acetyltransferase